MVRRLAIRSWLHRAASAAVRVSLTDWPHHLELWPGWDTGALRPIDCGLLYAVVEGEVRWDLGEGWQQAAAPCSLWFPAGCPLRVACVPGARLPVVRRLRWAWHDDAGAFSPRPAPLRRDDWGAILPQLQQLADEQGRGDDLARRRRHGLAMAVATHFFEGDEAPARDAWRARLAEIEQTVRRLLREDGSLPTPGDLARWCDRSPDYFARRFRRVVGISPRAWLSRQRLHEAARRLVASDRSAATIAAELGFDDPRVFNRVFRDHYGLPPGRWRHESGGVL